MAQVNGHVAVQRNDPQINDAGQAPKWCYLPAISGLTDALERLDWGQGGNRIARSSTYRRLIDQINRIVRARGMASYLIALLAVLFATAVRFGLEPWLGGRAHYLVFVVAVFIAAMFGGSLPAMFAAALSVFAVKLLGETPPGEPSAGVEFLTFAGASAVVIWLVHLIMQLRRQSALDEGRARRREEDAIRLVEERGLLLDGLHGHAIIMLDVEGRVRIWSKGAERLLGWSEGEANEEPWAFVYPASAILEGRPAADLDRARADGGFTGPAALLDKAGRPVSAEFSFAPLHDVRGRFRGYAIMLKGA
ncbi:MAG: DUF4118 domain-containing protein [Rhizorhabdus sp.]|jgi:two-component system, LuxR family, sensor kinase FixL|nr:MAG: DUF4118 domain-containing protein [Rhizorhabdus sp.]